MTEILLCLQPERPPSLISTFQYSILLVCLLSANISQAQTYSLETLEGTSTIVKIKNRTASIPFTISCSTDKLIVPNYWASGEIKVLSRKFLEIRYYVRGGSGAGAGNTMLLCINHGKLRQALLIESYSSNLNSSPDLDGKRTTQRIIDTRLTLDAANNMCAITYDTLVYGEDKGFKRSSLGSRKYTVRFNVAKDIFCNYQKEVNINLVSFKGNSINKKHFSGVAPAFRLNGTEYLFVESKWYAKSSNKGEYTLVD